MSAVGFFSAWLHFIQTELLWAHAPHLSPLHGEYTLILPAYLCISGGPGWPEDLTEEVDILPEGQAHLLQARDQPHLQCAAGCLHPQVSRPEGACVLRGLHPTAVSARAFGVSPDSHPPGSHMALSSPGTMWVCRLCAPTTSLQLRRSSPEGSTCRVPQWSSPTPSGYATMGLCPRQGQGR